MCGVVGVHLNLDYVLFLRFSYTCILINIWNGITTGPIMARGQWTGIGGTIKNQIVQHVKSGKFVISNPRQFSNHANKIIPSATTIYMPVEDVPDEPEEVTRAPAIPGTLKIHKIVRKMNAQQEFYHLSNDKEFAYTQYYRKLNDPIVCSIQMG